MIKLYQVNPDKEGLQQRIERKFFVIPHNLDFALFLLRQFCYADTEYPAEQINSVYFDTEDLEQYERSSSGEWRKNKVRLRWYGKPEDYSQKVPVIVELKSREGFAGIKQRQKMSVARERLALHELSQGIIPGSELADILAGFGYFPPAPIQPVILISYWRYRFNEMLSNTRVNLDLDIRSTIIKRSLGFNEIDLKLQGGVIEVKGGKMELPVNLRRMHLLDIDWSRFSKYSSCLDAHFAEGGSEARLWPSGRFIQIK